MRTRPNTDVNKPPGTTVALKKETSWLLEASTPFGCLAHDPNQSLLQRLCTQGPKDGEETQSIQREDNTRQRKKGVF